MAMNNQTGGVVDANATAEMILEPNSAGFTNQGTLEATNTGGLVLNGGQFNNNGGTILASGAGDNVYLQSNATISGGTLDGAGGGVVETASSQSVHLDGASQGTLTIEGNYIAHDNTSTYLSGAINLTGTLQAASAGNSTNLLLADGTTLRAAARSS